MKDTCLQPHAEDVVQEAYLRAWKFFGSFHGGESHAWLLTIVRHTCYTWLQHNRAPELTTVFDEAHHSVEDAITKHRPTTSTLALQ